MSISQLQYREMLMKERNRNAEAPPIGHGVSREKDLHEEIEQFCRYKGWVCFHSRMDKRQTANLGMPDFVIATDDGRTIYVEAKRKGGKCSPAQNAMLAWLLKNKQKAFVVQSMEEFLECIK